MDRSNNNKIYLYIVVGIFASIILFIIDQSSLVLKFRSLISAVYTPMSFVGQKYGRIVTEYFNFINNVEGFKNDYEKTKLENIELKSVKNAYTILKKEYESLEKQIKLSLKDRKYIKTEIVERYADGFCSINVGSEDGVSVGDPVVWGNIFVGRVSKVDSKTAVLRLASSSSSYVKVFIIPPDDLVEKNVEKISSLSKKGVSSVASGKDGGILLSDILADSGVKVGDVVITSDNRIDGSYILGRIISIDRDPAAALLNAEVEIAYEVDVLNFVYVMKDND